MEYSEIALISFSLISGYLLGSVLFGWIIAKLLTGKDIREMGDKNPGGRNIIRQVGFLPGAGAGILDILKVLGPLLIAAHFFHLANLFLFLIAFGAMMGHLYPLYFNFRGGRGASVIIGSCLFFVPYLLIIVAATIFLISLLTKFLAKYLVSLKSFSISVTLVIIVTVFVTLFLNYPGMVKLEIVFLASIALLNKATRDSLVDAFLPIIRRFKK